jgi:hypothetical protein
MVGLAKGRNISLPRKVNHSTGRVSNRQTGFNDASWGKVTRDYVQGIDLNLSNESFDKIIRCAKAFARKSRRAGDESQAGTSANHPIRLDKRAQLKDRPCSDEEYDAEDEDMVSV